MNTFLTISPPRWNLKEVENLNRWITSKEVKTVIKNLPKNQSPGPDSFTGKYYQMFKDDLISILESESEVTQSCRTFRDPMGYRLPGVSIHGIFQARILERFAIFFSRGSFQPRNRTWVSHTARQTLYHLSQTLPKGWRGGNTSQLIF